jgi:uncharacterized membrane protein YeaQ/YmgE (transglycosylase-associated protein family)
MHLTLVFLGVLAVGALAGLATRGVLGRRVRLDAAESTIAGIVGAGVGGGLVVALVDEETVDWRVMLGAVAGTFVVTAAVSVLATRVTSSRVGRPRPSTTDLVAGGEGEHVEFKETARYNAHTRARDPRLEQAVVKTVAGFLNSAGGTLLVGVSDAGEVLGIDDDLRAMKRPDVDRYELWLVDLLTGCLGTNALRLVGIEFPRVAGVRLCRVDVAPSPDPVFTDTPKGERRADFYVRVGNSTRQLLPDEVLDYERRHFR